MKSNYTIPVAKAGKNLLVDFAALPVASQEFIITYGLRKRLNDAHASVPEPDLAFAVAEKALAGLLAGEIRGQSSAGGLTPWENQMLGLLAKATKTKKAELAEKLKAAERDLAQVFASFCAQAGLDPEAERAKFLARSAALPSLDLDSLL